MKEQELLSRLDKLAKRVGNINDDICSGLSQEKAGVMVEYALNKPEGLTEEHTLVCKVLACYFLNKAKERHDWKGKEIWHRRLLDLYPYPV